MGRQVYPPTFHRGGQDCPKREKAEWRAGLPLTKSLQKLGASQNLQFGDPSSMPQKNKELRPSRRPTLIQPLAVSQPANMDAVKVAVVGSPFANLFPIYDVAGDEADVLLIVTSSTKPFAPWVEPVPNPYRPATAAVKSASGLRIKASSKHLILASRVFKNKLHHANAKTSTQSDGRIHLTLSEGFNPKAVSIVLNAIHSRGSKVPRTIDVETLAQIALFVDRFQLYDAVEVYADRWIAKLEDQLGEAYDRDLVLWIFVSHVFRRSDLFQAATKVAVAHTNGPLRTLGLPIREKIIRALSP